MAKKRRKLNHVSTENTHNDVHSVKDTHTQVTNKHAILQNVCKCLKMLRSDVCI